MAPFLFLGGRGVSLPGGRSLCPRDWEQCPCLCQPPRWPPSRWDPLLPNLRKHFPACPLLGVSRVPDQCCPRVLSVVRAGPLSSRRVFGSPVPPIRLAEVTAPTSPLPHEMSPCPSLLLQVLSPLDGSPSLTPLLASITSSPHSFVTASACGPLKKKFNFFLFWLFTLFLILKEKHVPIEGLRSTRDYKQLGVGWGGDSLPGAARGLLFPSGLLLSGHPLLCM